MELQSQNENYYDELSSKLKAISDKNRLKIIDMLSCGELCACHLLEGLGISQPTLSHHMKKLVQSGLVNARVEGSWTYYQLDLEAFEQTIDCLRNIFTEKEDCICKGLEKSSCSCKIDKEE
ncbi:MAG: metalloregulator ArsR/SmtB family transcription factor [Finegoldia sp.]|nr:metalloregulator ArsR/SmtB family transcription factor [Finegoldia sp.]